MNAHHNQAGFVLLSVLILIITISAIMVSIMDSIHLQSVLQQRLTQRWQVYQALNWSMASAKKHLPSTIADHCRGHLCQQSDLINLNLWTNLTLPGVFAQQQASFIANQFQVERQWVVQVLVMIRYGGRRYYMILAFSRLV